ncbi:MAG: hypothetical protein ACLQCU_02645 [Acidimicrobiales bacterium]
MKRIFKIGTGTVVAASMLATVLALAGPGAASATAVQRHSSSSQATAVVRSSSPKSYPLPRAATWYRAGTAGSVKIAALNSGTIRVVTVNAAQGYIASVDSASGSSVDVYFRHGTDTVKFEAEINDSGGLTVLVTTR